DEGFGVGRDRPLVLAELVLNEAEAVPGTGQPLHVAEFAVQPQGFLAVPERLGVPALLGQRPADVVDRDRLPAAVAGRPEQLQRLAGLAQRLVRRALAVVEEAEPEVGVALPRLVPQRREPVQRLPQVRERLVVLTQP